MREAGETGSRLPHAMTGMPAVRNRQAATLASVPGSGVVPGHAAQTLVRGSDAQFNPGEPEAQRV
jgi:hypothetical protein